ncbi:hypothetical protein PMAYCL1PPCAC_03786 [Pristionchus mayeri]|uniref:Uncharacterized protein n=1 Tax=Pristionchus mayeri TaxID=1317129 RepID=A0AAN5C9Y9_9BILA|nr:hypothetical protein PMAYCL1PPCAC_03786 [Pristionchus mayeri]
MPVYDKDLEAAFPLKEHRRSCFLAPCTCGQSTEKMVSIHFFIILVASLQSFSIFLFAGTPRDQTGVISASIGCALSLLPLPFLLFALYGIVYNRPNLILLLVVFLICLIAMYAALIVLDLYYELLVLPHFSFVLILLSSLHSIHAIRVMLRQRVQMIERNGREGGSGKPGRKRKGETGDVMRLEKLATDGREMFIYAQ